jgi:uncharacterized membrane protein
MGKAAISQEWTSLFLLFINSIGLCLSALSTSQEVAQSTELAEKFCTTFKTDCAAVTQSKDAKLFGIVSWAYLGLWYFVSTIIAFGLFGSLFIPLFLPLSLCCVTFSFYSVWYQYAVAKAWCALCLGMLIVFWANSFVASLYYSTYTIELQPRVLLLTVALFLLSGLAIANILYFLIGQEKAAQLAKETQPIKHNLTVFDTLLAEQNTMPPLPKDIVLTFQNEEDSTPELVFVTNPFCKPCSEVHRDLDVYQNGWYPEFAYQIIFKTDTDSSSTSWLMAKHIIGLYSVDAAFAKNAMHDWYVNSYKNIKDWQRKFDLNYDEIAAENSLKQHNSWCSENGINLTPSLFFRGKNMPPFYKVSDIRFFLD